MDIKSVNENAFETLKERVLANYKEIKYFEMGIPIHQSSRGSTYETRVMVFPKEMITSIDQAYEVFYQMANCFLRLKDGDLCSIRAIEIGEYENKNFDFWLRLALDKSEDPIVWQKSEDGYIRV